MRLAKIHLGLMKTVKHHSHDNMHYAVYPDGVPSSDFYNLARAKDHTFVLAETLARQARQERRQRSLLASSSDYFRSVGASSL